MAQIAFLTLFLGLTLGSQPIELTVTGPAAAVELLLDGAPAGRIAGPPWKGQIDFGASLLPHELVARALDSQGNEIGRVSQWVNLPRPPAEVDILLESGADGRPVAARLTWQSLTGESPSAVEVSFDDKPLVVGPDGRVKLPAWDPETSHVLSAELRFSGAFTARRDVAFGGRWGDQVSMELTAVPVRLRPGKKLPPPEGMQGWFVAGGRPVPVAAVEEDGPAELLVVRDPAAQPAFQKALSGAVSGAGKPRSVLDPAVELGEYRRYHMTLGKDDAVRFIVPTARAVPGSSLPAELFNTSRGFSADEGGLLWFLGRFVVPAGPSGPQRLSDAVAVAGLQTLVANHRRAVLLVLSETPQDASRSQPAMVRRYLEAIRVPLAVWTVGEVTAPEVAPWGGAEEVSSFSRLRKAFNRLEKELESQAIVWIGGRHLPQSIGISADAAAVLELVGAAPMAPAGR